MKYLLTIGTVFTLPLVSHSHDGEHITTVWYQEPVNLATIIVAVLALTGFGYAVMKKKRGFVIVPTTALVLIAMTLFTFSKMNVDEYEPRLAMADFGAGHTVTLYKSPTCGCCSGHAEALEEAGFTVGVVETNELDTIKSAQNIPPNGASCHTSVIGDYVVEGHVPLEAIEKLLDEKPDIAGIGLAGMPIGTPGMPGPKTAPYEVYQLLEEGEMSPYLTI